VSRFAGLFRLARRLTRRRLRILCYHGFATGDVLEFRPGLFISPETFERRLSFLASAGYPVLTLEAALAGLDRGDLPPQATVITVDDVFQGFVEHAVPLLKAYRLPVTAYVTTYYAEHREPVFRLVVRYMFWKTREAALHMTAGDGQPALTCTRSDSASWQRGQDSLIAFGEQLPSERDRTELAKRLGLLCRVDYDSIVASGVFNIVSTEQVRRLASEGVDIQLHTHRHRLPERKDLVTREIADNRRVLEPLAHSPLTHLCYPSGIWSRTVWPWLEECGIRSATTCEPGLNSGSTARLALRRILDAEDLPQIRFEAEMSGYKHMLRALVSRTT